MSVLRRVRALKKPIPACNSRCFRPFLPLFIDAVTAIDWKPAWEGHGDAAAKQPLVPSGKIGHGGGKRERAKELKRGKVEKKHRICQTCAHGLAIREIMSEYESSLRVQR